MKTERFSIINDNAFQRIKDIKDKSIDLILTDPPYNIGKYSRGNIRFEWREDINNRIADWDQGQFDPAMIADEFVRVLKPDGNLFIFCSYNLIGRWHQLLDNKFDTTQFMVWHKTNPTPNFFKTSFLNSCELVFCCWNKGHKWNFTTQNAMHNFFESPICGGKERLKDPKHPTQKPVGILQHIIKIASNEHDIILDPFMGVGSVGEAALRLNRRFVGIEIEELYYQAAKNRIIKINEI